MVLVTNGLIAAACYQGLDYPAPPSNLNPSPERAGTDAGAAAENCGTIKTEARTILETNCAPCHQAPAKSGGFDYVLDVDKLKSSGMVVPGNPEGSLIYSRIAAGEMPPQGQTQRPSRSDATVIYQWIKVCTLLGSTTADGGAGSSTGSGGSGAGGSTGWGGGDMGGSADAGTTVTAPFIDNATILRWILSDISISRIEDQRFQRYLSLAHLSNAGASGQTMDIARFALGKAINALSQGTQLVVPRPIDRYETVFRIDLRDLAWDATATRTDRWEILAAADPYAIEFVEDAARITKNLARTKIFVQSGNWLVFAGTQPPLYHQILGIPATLTELQTQLGTNIQQDIVREQVWRSGFADSAIALANRVLERHLMPSGGRKTLWISYDFAGDGGRENIFSNPLDFQADASEIIFSLPNGMHGYMLVNALGNRLDVGDDRVVTDSTQRSGNVINGISCIGCHDAGFKFKKDEVRPFVDQSVNFGVQTKEIVDKIYVAPDVFQSVVSEDSSVFLQSLQKLSPPTTTTVEPVSNVFHEFEQDVDLRRAAAELGFTRDQLLSQLGRLDPALAPLATSSIKRDVFKAKFAQTVCLLRIGIANDAACR